MSLVVTEFDKGCPTTARSGEDWAQTKKNDADETVGRRGTVDAGRNIPWRRTGRLRPASSEQASPHRGVVSAVRARVWVV